MRNGGNVTMMMEQTNTAHLRRSPTTPFVVSVSMIATPGMRIMRNIGDVKTKLDRINTAHLREFPTTTLFVD